MCGSCVCGVQMELLLQCTWSPLAWKTSLMAATEGRHVEAVIRLLTHSPDMTASDFEPALSIATEAGDMEMVQTLVTHAKLGELARQRCLTTGVKSARQGQVRPCARQMQLKNVWTSRPTDLYCLCARRRC